jgi:tetratricopeptide (TPR) repeat protein
MLELEIERGLKTKNWEANKRTIPRARRVSDEVLDRAAALKDQGRFADAVDLLRAEPDEVLSGDAVALNGLGHFLFGDGHLEDALLSYRSAEGAARRDLAKALVNQATVLKTLKRYDEALAVAERARELEPAWFVPYLTLMAIHEWRGEEADKSAVASLCKSLTANCPGWEDNAELWRFLLTDVDYARLRSDTTFSETFGTSAEDAQRRFNYAR